MIENDNTELANLAAVVDRSSDQWLHWRDRWSPVKEEETQQRITDLNVAHFALINKVRSIALKKRKNVPKKSSPVKENRVLGPNDSFVTREETYNSESDQQQQTRPYNRNFFDGIVFSRISKTSKFAIKSMISIFKRNLYQTTKIAAEKEIALSSYNFNGSFTPQSTGSVRDSSRDRRFHDYKDVQDVALAQMENLQRSVLLNPSGGSRSEDQSGDGDLLQPQSTADLSSPGSSGSYHSAFSSTPPEARRQPIRYGSNRKGTETLRVSPDPPQDIQSRPNKRTVQPYLGSQTQTLPSRQDENNQYLKKNVGISSRSRLKAYVSGRQRKTETLAISPERPAQMRRDKSCDLSQRKDMQGAIKSSLKQETPQNKFKSSSKNAAITAANMISAVIHSSSDNTLSARNYVHPRRNLSRPPPPTAQVSNGVRSTPKADSRPNGISSNGPVIAKCVQRPILPSSNLSCHLRFPGRSLMKRSNATHSRLPKPPLRREQL
ncbi:hypothetical protein ACOME3_007572 [Neoechinorhynchus agilis]